MHNAQQVEGVKGGFSSAAHNLCTVVARGLLLFLSVQLRRQLHYD